VREFDLKRAKTDNRRGARVSGPLSAAAKLGIPRSTLDSKIRSLKGSPKTDALAKLLIEKGIITQQEFLAKISEERATYQAMFKPTPH